MATCKYLGCEKQLKYSPGILYNHMETHNQKLNVNIEKVIIIITNKKLRYLKKFKFQKNNCAEIKEHFTIETVTTDDGSHKDKFAICKIIDCQKKLKYHLKSMKTHLDSHNKKVNRKMDDVKVI